ncbi:M81 family metallopeptidase [Muricoccus radiodurans]|uniref:M81 family metallopeptidase n=1 Tax=Muricoccus radiodurans TaxID=2231721 RepID=UPI003CF83D1C
MAEHWRIAIGQLSQETNHFNPVPTTEADFAASGILRGDAVLHGWGEARREVPGFLEVLRAAGHEAVPTLAAWCPAAGGPVSRAAFEALLGGLLDRLRAAGPVDGVLLALHGAMMLEDSDDAESEIIARVRAELPPGTPVGVSLDLHGHVTPAMLQPDVFFVAYREYPHIDMQETGERVARLMLDRLAGRRRPVMALAKRPMVVSPVGARTPDPPLSDLVALARAAEAAGEALHVGLFPVQPWLDVPDLGFAVLVTADGDAGRAQAVADRIAEAAWAMRNRFGHGLIPLEEAIRIGLAGPGTTVIGDGGDAPTGGSPADNPSVLRALLAAGADRHDRPILLTMSDPQAAAEAHAAGIGACRGFRLGHAHTPGEPVVAEAEVVTLHDGRFALRDGGATGSVIDHGPSAVLRIGALRIALRSAPGNEWDTNVYRSLGLEPSEAAAVFVKSPAHFRVAYGPLAARVVAADTPGPCAGNTARVPWTRVTRPLWPLDDV